MRPGHGWAQLDLATDAAGWRAQGEIGLRRSWGDIYGLGWARQDAAGVGLGVRW